MIFYKIKQACKKIGLLKVKISNVRYNTYYHFFAFEDKEDESISIEKFLKDSNSLASNFEKFCKKFDIFFGFVTLAKIKLDDGNQITVCDYKKDVEFVGILYKKVSLANASDLMLMYGNMQTFLEYKIKVDPKLKPKLKDLVMSLKQIKAEILEYNQKIDDLIKKLATIEGKDELKAASLISEAVRHGARLSGAIEVFLEFCEQEIENIQG